MENGLSLVLHIRKHKLILHSHVILRSALETGLNVQDQVVEHVQDHAVLEAVGAHIEVMMDEAEGIDKVVLVTAAPRVGLRSLGNSVSHFFE